MFVRKKVKSIIAELDSELELSNYVNFSWIFFFLCKTVVRLCSGRNYKVFFKVKVFLRLYIKTYFSLLIFKTNFFLKNYNNFNNFFSVQRSDKSIWKTFIKKPSNKLLQSFTNKKAVAFSYKFFYNFISIFWSQ